MIRSALYFLLLLSLLLGSCAQQAALTGGPRDEVPPQLDTTKSAANYKTNFVKQEIELHFDEYVDLKDAAKQIVISPPLRYPPIIKSRLKRLRIGFDDREILKDNATYVVNFGKSIRDFTEGNELPNYAYVFSTGDYIDSLTISGSVEDVLTGEPLEDIVVMLYVDHRDSIVFQERPFYFARTDKEGYFKIKNLRADTFKVVAIMDENLDYLYNPRNEQIGFLDTLVTLQQDSVSGLNIEIWKEQSGTSYTSYDVEAKGKLLLDFNGPVAPDDITILDSINYYIEQKKAGTSPLVIWYTPITRGKVSWITNTAKGLDTVSARINQRTTDTLENTLKVSKWNFDAKTGLHPLESLTFESTRPIAVIDTTLISLKDTTRDTQVPYELDSMTLPLSTVGIKAVWPEEEQLQFTLLPGALRDFFGKTNDTIVKYIAIGKVSNFGTINITAFNFDSIDYIIQLKKDKVVLKESIKTKDLLTIQYDKLPPGEYSLTIIQDANSNSRWDPGNYLEKRQAERIYNTKMDPLREDWTLDFRLDLQELKRAAEQKTPPAKPNESSRR